MKHQYLKNVATLQLFKDKCVGCGKCTEVCPHGVFAVQNGKAAIVALNSCMECSACTQNCPVSALTVDKGVGCASAVIMGWLTNSEPSCGCSAGSDCC
ncbi:MAG: mercury methylation ferredoxin HgcB [Oscillospiraceae bacterium]